LNGKSLILNGGKFPRKDIASRLGKKRGLNLDRELKQKCPTHIETCQGLQKGDI
jgi:hypothetical protein